MSTDTDGVVTRRARPRAILVQTVWRSWLVAVVVLPIALVQRADATTVHAPTPTATMTRSPTVSASPTITQTPMQTPTRPPTPVLVADANCDGAGSAADFAAAIIVSADSAQFPTCTAANQFRGRFLTDEDFIPILHDIFATFDAPWTPTPTASPTVTLTRTRTLTPTQTPLFPPSHTATVTASPTATPTSSPTDSATSTPTFTPTRLPTNTRTTTPTPTSTPTRTGIPTPTPTGLAYQLSGSWFASWTGQICYLNGQAFTYLMPTTYQVTAVDGRLDIQIVNGVSLGRGLALDAEDSVETQ